MLFCWQRVFFVFLNTVDMGCVFVGFKEFCFALLALRFCCFWGKDWGPAHRWHMLSGTCWPSSFSSYNHFVLQNSLCKCQSGLLLFTKPLFDVFVEILCKLYSGKRCCPVSFLKMLQVYLFVNLKFMEPFWCFFNFYFSWNITWDLCWGEECYRGTFEWLNFDQIQIRYKLICMPFACLLLTLACLLC